MRRAALESFTKGACEQALGQAGRSPRILALLQSVLDVIAAGWESQGPVELPVKVVQCHARCRELQFTSLDGTLMDTLPADDPKDTATVCMQLSKTCGVPADALRVVSSDGRVLDSGDIVV